jgi:hypothetical protein
MEQCLHLHHSQMQCAWKQGSLSELGVDYGIPVSASVFTDLLWGLPSIFTSNPLEPVGYHTLCRMHTQSIPACINHAGFVHIFCDSKDNQLMSHFLPQYTRGSFVQRGHVRGTSHSTAKGNFCFFSSTHILYEY